MGEVTECTAADRDEFWQDTPQDATGATETGERKAHKWTEREVLDALHLRLCRLDRGLTSRRYVVAEHARLDPMWTAAILDLVAVDTWRSGGYGLHGFEVKVSRSDLRRELNNLGKAAKFEQHLNTFTIVAPTAVLSGWREMAIPERWGLMAVADDGLTRYLRKAVSQPGYSDAERPVERALFAALSRAVANTAQRHCVRHGDLKCGPP